jgi:hypothetical protein
MIHGINVGMFYYKDKWVISGYCGNNVYSRQFCYRNNKNITDISSLIEKPFWELWEFRGWKLPDPVLNRCYMFACHPEENILKLVGGRYLNFPRNFSDFSRDMNSYPFPELDMEKLALENNWECVTRIELDPTRILQLIKEGEDSAKIPVPENEPPVGKQFFPPFL